MTRTTRKLIRILAAPAALLALAACGDSENPTAPNAPTASAASADPSSAKGSGGFKGFTARASGTVVMNGPSIWLHARSQGGVLSAVSPFPGVVCLELSPTVFPDAGTAVAIVSPHGKSGMAMTGEIPNAMCPAGPFIPVLTLNPSGDFVNMGFNYIIM